MTPMVQIRNVVSKVDPANPRDDPDREFMYIDISSIDNRQKKITAPRRLLGRDAPSRARQRVRAGDVLVSTTRPYLNAVALVPDSLDRQVCSTGFAVLRSGDSRLDSRYLFRFVQSPAFITPLVALVQGALYPAVSDRDVLDRVMPLPDPARQTSIAAQLDVRLDAALQIRTAIVGQKEDVRVLRESALRLAFDVEPEATKTPLSLTGQFQDGDWILTSDYSTAGVRLFQVGDVGSGSLLAKSSRFVSAARATELRCTFLRAGDILISRMPDPIGRACMVPEFDYEAITAVDVTIFRPDPMVLDPEFAVQYMNSPAWLRAVAEKASGATRARISRLNLETIEIPLPALSRQRDIAKHLRRQLRASDAMADGVQRELDAIDALPSALLREAFDQLAR